MTALVQRDVIDLTPERRSMPIVQPANETAAVLAIIERAARDPSVDIDKLRQLLELRDRAEAREAQRGYFAAMAEAQGQMAPIRADSRNPQTRSNYASYDALDRALRPIYSKHGFTLSFDTEPCGENIVRVICQVSHVGGHSRRHQIDMPSDGKGAKGGDVMTKTHATGSAVSYGMRYLLKMIFNIAVTDRDDDGNTAAAGATIAEEQLVRLQTALLNSGADEAKFLAFYKIASLSDLPAKQYDAAMRMLAQKAKAK